MDALGHAWDNGKVTKEPTETETGVKTFTCTRCGGTRTETMPVIPHVHSYKDVVTAPTCTAKGYTTHTCACGDSYVDTYVDALGHAWDNGKVTKEPTEAEDGVKTFTCTRCGETKTETLPKLAHEHSYDAVVTAPTCTEKGYTTHTCACGDSYVDTYVDALGHAWDEGVVVKAATKDKTGTRKLTCTRCGEVKETIIPMQVVVADRFDDVSATSWSNPGIQYCVENGLMSGTGGDQFAPSIATTRAQIVQILYNLEGEPKVSGTTPFTDLTNDWYQDAVLWAYQTGVVAGTSATTFEPDRPVTREQIAVILMEYVTRVLKLERTWTPADLSIFPDAGSVSDWAKDAMADAVALGLISGASNGGQTYLEPQGSATREQVATILMEFCKNVKKVIQLSGCTLQILRGASFAGRETFFLSFCRCTWYTILYNFIRRYFSMPENYITCQDEKGSINISEDVVAAMVRAAITEVDGVAGVATSTGTELAELLGIKSAAKGIKVQIVDGTMTVDTIITVRYGCSVVAVAKAVQESVTSAVESMTGMGKPIVNVHVSGVAFDK